MKEIPIYKVNRLLNSTELDTKFKSFSKLTKHQKDIFIPLALEIENVIKNNMVSDNIISLSGSAGVGKTFVTSKIIELFNILNYNITITAPTHKAVNVLSDMLKKDNLENISIRTIQSFLNLRQQKSFDTGSINFVPEYKNDILKTDLLIIDESSMVGNKLYEYIIQAIEQDRCKAVLFIGDYYQLPAIEGGKSPIFESKNRYKLEKIVRQAKNSYIIDLSTKIRNVIKTKQYEDITNFIQENSDDKLEIFYSSEEFINDFTTPDNWYKNEKILTSFSNDDVNHYNKIIRGKYWEAHNNFNPATLIKDDILVLQSAHLIDNKIIHQNNETITISKVEPSAIKILGETLNYFECTNKINNKILNILDPQSKNMYNDRLNRVALKAKREKNKQERNKIWKIFFTLKEFFVDVKYSFASTIHKLQGSTYETVYIDLTSLAKNFEYTKDKDLFFRLIYVALTRASKNVKILLPNNNISDYYNQQKDILTNIDFEF
jgi:exodeoxyribonuclease V